MMVVKSSLQGKKNLRARNQYNTQICGNLKIYRYKGQWKRRRIKIKNEVQNEQHQQLSYKALKELAIVCAALKSGDQTIIFRKGGIKESSFAYESQQFLLFPTAFHENQSLWKPRYFEKFQQWESYDPKRLEQLQFETYCKVTGAWTVFDEGVFNLLDKFHICTTAFAEQRLKWRQKQPMTIMELRCQQIEPISIPSQEKFFGCFSWGTQ
eukprot:TRINITY_DN17342_c0_g5_i2.p1 TRINITY_DN17342_c0_g5~~TRINITY_DN17342_c0_g5_i2.p1  ORF type:complete len:210 (-),score=13.63 TRINITY_DN17342_c0_g5_i2:1055-1684(-)